MYTIDLVELCIYSLLSIFFITNFISLGVDISMWREPTKLFVLQSIGSLHYIFVIDFREAWLVWVLVIFLSILWSDM